MGPTQTFCRVCEMSASGGRPDPAQGGLTSEPALSIALAVTQQLLASLLTRWWMGETPDENFSKRETSIATRP